jgi:uncharacterized protein Yka (UPF0111/DUF47 family)
VEKKDIIEELGEGHLLLPELVNTALEANDRVKYLLSLLQTARARADEPGAAFTELAAERRAANVQNAELDTVVAGTSKSTSGDYHIPNAETIVAGLRAGMADMLAPVTANDLRAAKPYRVRLDSLLAQAGTLEDGLVTGALIDKMAAGDQDGEDSLHILVMDLHKVLNTMQTDLSTEVIDGAHTYLLKERDKDVVRAFMRGVNRTSPLRFDHPGLGATATRTGKKLMIQNDIGMTDAHVLVIAVAGLVTTITYTDVHLVRLQFLTGLLSRWRMKWNSTVAKDGKEGFEKGTYHLAVGEFTADDREDLAAFLEFLGSRLVFLIDWNRARKALREFLPKSDCITALRWAAEQEVGHMGFLKVGGATLIHEALEVADPLRYRQPLWEVIGKEEAIAYVQNVLRVAATGLLAHRSRLLINDEIRTELLRHFRSGHQALLDQCAEQAMIITDAASALQQALRAVVNGGDAQKVARTSERCKRWERESDDLVNSVRALAKRTGSAGFFSDLLKVSDDVLDSLEEAAFLITLSPSDRASQPAYASIVRMSELVLEGSREYLKALIAAGYVQKDYGRDEMEDFLRPIDRVLNLEREGDDAHRVAQKLILQECTDFRQLSLLRDLARTVEDGMNGFMRAVYILRDYILENASR